MNLRTELSPIDGTIHGDNIALLIACKAASTYEQLQRAEPIFFPDDNSYSLMIDGPRFTRTTIVWKAAQKALLIVVNGIDENWSQVPALLDSWVTAADSGDTGNIFAEAGAQILTEVNGFGVAWETITVIGHSFGGAVAHWLGWAMSTAVPQGTGQVWVYTYGSPKTAPSGMGYPGVPVYYRRVMLNRDPVPALPPSPTDMGSIWMLCGIPTARAWERWRHARQGYKVFADGSIAVQQMPALIDDPGLIFTLFSWVTGIHALGNPNHSLASYQSMCSLIAAATRASSLPVTSRDTSHAPTMTAVQIQTVRDTAVATTATTVASSPEAAAIGVMTGIARVPGQRFYGGRVNGKPYVFYNGLPILPTRTLRVRRAVIRRLNATLPF